MASDISTLIASLREAREGSRELDIAICMACFATLRAPMEYVKGDPWLFFDEPFYKQEPPPVTTDLSAAVALAKRVLPDWTVALIEQNFGWGAEVRRIGVGTHIDWPKRNGDVNAPTPALALCLAVLIAKEKADA